MLVEEGECIGWRPKREMVRGKSAEGREGGEGGLEGIVGTSSGDFEVGTAMDDWSSASTVGVERDDEATVGASPAFRRRSCTSRPRRKLRHASMRSCVWRLMTPIVRWRVPRGRTAFSGIGTVEASAGSTASPVNRSSEAKKSGLEDVVTRGRHRKCVKAGLGGIMPSGKGVKKGDMTRLEAVLAFRCSSGRLQYCQGESCKADSLQTKMPADA